MFTVINSKLGLRRGGMQTVTTVTTSEIRRVNTWEVLVSKDRQSLERKSKKPELMILERDP